MNPFHTPHISEPGQGEQAPTGRRSEQCDWLLLVPYVVHPVKVAIVEALHWVDRPLSASQLIELFDGSDSGSVSHHLRALAGSGIVEVRGTRDVRGAREVFYGLARPREWDELASLLAHPLKVSVIEAMTWVGPLSASQLQHQVGAPTSNVSYHVRALARMGVLRVVERRQVRGAIETTYEFAPPPGPLS